MLTLRDVDAFHGRAQVLFGLSLEVGPGEVVALMGRNGAGKSTTFHAILGLGVRRRGVIRFADRDLVGLPAHAIARAGIGWVPEDRRVFPGLTVAENLEVGRRPPVAGRPAWTEDALFGLFPNLAALRHRPAAHMSGGEQQMLAIARTLIGNPALLLLDEPSEGLAPRIVEQMAAAVAEVKRQGLSVLLAEQSLAFAGAVADRAVVIEGGRARYQGAFATLRDDADLRHRYLAL